MSCPPTRVIRSRSKSPVPGVRGVVEQPPVQLDDERLGVGGVAVDLTHPADADRLPGRPGESVRPLDEGEIAVLEHRTGALVDVTQHAGDPLPPRHPRSLRHGSQQALCGGTPRLHCLREGGDDGELAPGRARHVDRRLLVAHAGRAQVPAHLLGVAAPAVQAHLVGRDQAAVAFHDHVDRQVNRIPSSGTVRGAEGGLVTECRRRGEHDRCPGLLQPRELAGVVDVDPVVHGRPETSAQHPRDLVVGPASSHQLTSGDHARLELKEVVDSGVHRRIVTARVQGRHPHSSRLWTTGKWWKFSTGCVGSTTQAHNPGTWNSFYVS